LLVIGVVGVLRYPRVSALQVYTDLIPIAVYVDSIHDYNSAEKLINPPFISATIVDAKPWVLDVGLIASITA